MTHPCYAGVDDEAFPYTEPIYCRIDESDFEHINRIQAKYGNAQGDCFKKNYVLFQKLLPTNPHIDYAIIDLEYLKSGNRIRHAVVVDGEFIIDVSQGRRLKLDKDYYLRNDMCPIKIHSHFLYNKQTIPSLDTILDKYAFYKTNPLNSNKMIKGDYKCKGKWEVSKDSIINL